MLRWTPHLHATRLAAAPSPAETTLLSGVQRVQFAYCCKDGQFVAAWPETTLPALVRISLIVAGGARQAWPPIVVTPMRMRLNG